MKIGIITFHDADNLGAVLQAYALQKYLQSEINVCAEIINYKCEAVEQTKYAKWQGGNIKQLCRYSMLSLYYYIKHRGFQKFRKNSLLLSEQVYTKENISESNKIYDVFVFGSDQIWNLKCSGNDDTFFGDFVSTGKKLYSYAASLGIYRYNENESKHIAPLAARFNGISLRETSALSEMEKMHLANMQIHPDPVLLLEAEQWKGIMHKRLLKKKYVFVYLIQEDVNVMKAAKEYAEKNSCQIINNKKSIEFILNNSPADFLSWIYYAECVFTNSFHGTVFSLIFEKPLAADVELVGGGINNRIYELLISVNAEKCILTPSIGKVHKIESFEKIESMRNVANVYLKDMVESGV